MGGGVRCHVVKNRNRCYKNSDKFLSKRKETKELKS